MTTTWFHYNDKVQNKKEKLAFAREMRKHPTLAEKHLWQFLKDRQLGVHVTRQKMIMGYIADFYIPKARLIIECDGGYHQNTKPYDNHRDKALTNHTFKVVRFQNDYVLRNTSSVIARIRQEVATRHFTSSILT